MNRGEAAVLAEPGADYSKAILELAKSILPQQSKPDSKAPRPEPVEELSRPWDFTIVSPGKGKAAPQPSPSPNGHRPATAADAPEVDPYAELKARIHHACIAKLGPELFRQEDGEDLGERVYRAVTEELTLDRTPLTREERRELVRQLTDDILGYGPLEPLLRDDSVTEIMVNAFDKIYVERSGRLERTDIRFVDDAHVMRIIDKIVSQIGRRVDEASPMVDARLPDGSRVNAIIPPLALNGPTVTIRKFSRDPYTINDLITFGTLTARSAQFLAACVKGKLNILISGGTGTGKTTTLNAMSRVHPDRRAHRHDRGRGGASAAAGPRRSRSSRARRTSKAWARSRSASSSGTRCACGPTGSSSARSAGPRPSTCSRR